MFSKEALLVATLTGCASFFLIAHLAPLHTSEAMSTAQRPTPGTLLLKQSSTDVGVPIRLTIPSIHVDAVIESVGLTVKGAMDVPADPDHAGWYNRGPRPGEKGSAVIDGHLNWYKGKTAVFQHLDQVQSGALLSIETDKGLFLLFMVRKIRTYNPMEYAPDVFLSTGGIHLNLVTCDGAWDSVRKIYNKRLVIFADKVDKM